MDLKLVQDLVSMEQDTLFLVFIDIRKAYYNLYQGRLLQTLAGYGEGQKLWGLLAEFWTRQEVVTLQNGFRGPQLLVTRGTTQGIMAPFTLSNMEVNSVVHHWLSLTV